MTGISSAQSHRGAGRANAGGFAPDHGFDHPALSFLTPDDVAHYVADMSYELARMAHSRGHARIAQLLTIVWAESKLTAHLPPAVAPAR